LLTIDEASYRGFGEQIARSSNAVNDLRVRINQRNESFTEHPMNLKRAKDLIRERGLTIVAEQGLNNGRGTQLRTEEGPILDVYNSGKVVLGGTQQDLLRPLLAGKDNQRCEPAARNNVRLGQLKAENRFLKSSLADREFVIESMTEYLAEERRRRADGDWKVRRPARRWR
jgi:hypothetical protein